MRISDWSSDVCSSDLSPGIPKDCLARLSSGPASCRSMKPNRCARRCATSTLRSWTRWPPDGGACRAKLRGDRKSLVQGKSVSVRVVFGGRRILKKQIKLQDSHNRHLYKEDHTT